MPICLIRGGVMEKFRACWPGVLLTVALAWPASWLGGQFPLIGAAIFGIVAGVLLGNLRRPPAVFQPGIALSARQLLQASIVLLGLGLPLTRVWQTGLASLPVTLATLSAALLSAWLVGRWLRVPFRLSVLIGTGTAICGGSAIAAITPVLRPDAHETAFSLSTIFLFNLLAVLVFPLLGHWLEMSDLGFGFWAGTAINDTSSVVAAAYAWSHTAGDYATIVKLTRALMIVPATIGLALWLAWREQRTQISVRGVYQSVPGFTVFFVLASLLGPFIPASWHIVLPKLAGFMITMALTAIGLGTDLRAVRQTGWRPVLLGLAVWISVAGTSLLMQFGLAHW